MIGYLVSDGGVNNVIESAVGGGLVSDRLEKLQWVIDSPAGEGIDPYVSFVDGRHLRWFAIPFEESFVQVVDLFKDRLFKVQAGIFYNPLILAELGYYHLFGFKDGVDERIETNQDDNNNYDSDN